MTWIMVGSDLKQMLILHYASTEFFPEQRLRWNAVSDYGIEVKAEDADDSSKYWGGNHQEVGTEILHSKVGIIG